MNLTIHSTMLPHNDPDESLAFYRDTLGFEVRNDVGYGGMRWITVGPVDQPGTSIVLYPPEATPGITDDERRMIVEMMANLHGMPGPQSCLQTDPLADPTLGVTGGFTPAFNNVATNNAQTREDPNRWNTHRDDAAMNGAPKMWCPGDEWATRLNLFIAQADEAKAGMSGPPARSSITWSLRRGSNCSLRT